MINVLFVIWTSCALMHANHGMETTLDQEQIYTIACNLDKKTINIKQLNLAEINAAYVSQVTIPMWWFDFLKWKFYSKTDEDRVFEIVTIEG